MPYSIFFTKKGNAVHGSHEVRTLGRAVSHGCVRLAVKNAATLWRLVKKQKMANTTGILSGAIPDGSPAMARTHAQPPRADGPHYGTPPQTATGQGNATLPFPFFLFGR
jgi:hypothetical protein